MDNNFCVRDSLQENLDETENIGKNTRDKIPFTQEQLKFLQSYLKSVKPKKSKIKIVLNIIKIIVALCLSLSFIIVIFIFSRLYSTEEIKSLMPAIIQYFTGLLSGVGLTYALKSLFTWFKK